MTHEHNYEMEFVGDGLDYRLVCRCGDVAPNMSTALLRQARSREARLHAGVDGHLVVAAVCTVLGVAAAVVVFIVMMVTR